MVPSQLIDALQRCRSLRHLWRELRSNGSWLEEADSLMEVQRAVPRVQWRMGPAPCDYFDTMRDYCSGNCAREQRYSSGEESDGNS